MFYYICIIAIILLLIFLSTSFIICIGDCYDISNCNNWIMFYYICINSVNISGRFIMMISFIIICLIAFVGGSFATVYVDANRKKAETLLVDRLVRDDTFLELLEQYRSSQLKESRASHASCPKFSKFFGRSVTHIDKLCEVCTSESTVNSLRTLIEVYMCRIHIEKLSTLHQKLLHDQIFWRKTRKEYFDSILSRVERKAEG